MELGPIVRALRRNKTRFGLHRPRDRAHPRHRHQLRDHDPRGAHARWCARPGFDDDNIVIVRSTPFDPAFKEDGYLDNSLRRRPRRAARDARRGRGDATRSFLPWQGGGSSTEMRPAGSKGEMLRTQIYNADEAHARRPRRAGHRGRAASPATGGHRHPCACAQLFKAERETGAGRPAQGEVHPGRGDQPRLREARLRRRLARSARCSRTATATMYRVVGRHRRLLQPVRLAHPRVRRLLREPQPQLRGRRAVPRPHRARPRRRADQGAGGHAHRGQRRPQRPRRAPSTRSRTSTSAASASSSP